eukprot:TRINITY_DN8069_c0_g1_i1.p1 TRINITY_DN8069_c0_g1~~TRINITY_DN8069_c0_g1_i1.p1  ORF type:complete len:490 (-),score=168.01 TRINITY_DN8069_c0_g1_i1:852-2321(-)
MNSYKKTKNYSPQDNDDDQNAEYDIEAEEGYEGEEYENEEYEHAEYDNEEYDNGDGNGDGQDEGVQPEDPEITKQCQEYLERREKLKEFERQKLRRASRNLPSSNKEGDKKLRNDDFGSFFGPSQPVVARRVIEEAKARLEAARISAKTKVSKENAKVSHSADADGVLEENGSQKMPSRKIVDQAKSKAQKLKEARDYSFLFSDDAEIPGDDKASTSGSRKDPPVKTGNGAERQLSGKGPVNGSLKQLNGKTAVKGPDRQQHGKGVVSSKVTPTTQILRTKVLSNRDHPPQGRGGAPVDSSKMVKGNLHPNGLKKEKRGLDVCPRNVSSSLASRQQQMRPLTTVKSTGKPLSKTNAHMIPGANCDSSKVTKVPSRPDTRVSKVQSKPQPKHHTSHTGGRPVKKPADDDDEGDYRSMIRKMMGYDPRKYRDVDDDDPAMEVGFSTIQAEERRSAKIARKEDEEQLALIEAEERAERERKLKKRKLQKAME